MHVTLHPGTSRDNALQALTQVATDVGNLYTSYRGDAGGLLLTYLEWANDAVARLTNQVSERDIDRLVLTRRYDHLLTGAAEFGAADLTKFTNSLVRLELAQRVGEFDAVVRTLRRTIERRVQPTLNAVFDTSMYIQHPEKLEAIDFRKLAVVYEGTVNLMVPMAVIDELDRLKESKDQQQRWRSRYSLAVIDRLFPNGQEPFAVLHRADLSEIDGGGRARPEVTVEIVFDPPGHIRLPNIDDEIIDRALAMRPLAASPVRMYTYDTGQSTRARNAGLVVEKLSLPLGEEPSATSAAAPGRGRRGSG
ncbi:PIN domain-containing protein [Kitasatospora sp. NPDC058218]|uniref:PIN domain-containing protein n=1 Tax=Kitasatospora sp. NPDC058218 TaxID=3346385 RepID=UPI0036DD1F52